MQNKIEESVKEGRVFYLKALAMQSPHMVTRAKRFAHGFLTDTDYKDVQVVKDFHEEIHGEMP
jgi:hypothetical protein